MSLLTCTNPPPGQLAILKKPIIPKDPSEDPVFFPRKRPYTLKELKRVFSLIPLTILPLSLIPTPGSPRPPEMYYGWLITDTLRARLMAKAYELDTLVYNWELVRCPTDECRSGYKRIQRDVDEFITLDHTANAILKKLHLVVPSKQIVNSVSLPDNAIGRCVALYSNLTLDRALPSDTVISGFSAYLGLTEEPQWWPTARFDWVD